MLKPAIIYKEEIIENFQKYYYTTDMMYETGSLSNWCPNIDDAPQEGHFQYAIVNSDDELIGYLSYQLDLYVSCAYNFGIISFDRGNPIVGEDLYGELDKLINQYHLHRIEWRMVGGNPIEKHYDKFCKKYNGTKHILIDAIRDPYGKYHNNVIYEIINKENQNE